MDDSMFTREMKLLWQNSDVGTRNRIAFIILKYFHEGNRGFRVIEKMQEGIE